MEIGKNSDELLVGGDENNLFDDLKDLNELDVLDTPKQE